MAGAITCTWDELLAKNVDGTQTINLLRACFVKTAKKREAGLTGNGASAPVGFTERVLKEIDDLTNAAFIAACEANETEPNMPAPVIATRGANRVLCKMYRQAKQNPDGITLSLDADETKGIIEFQTCRLRGTNVEDIITYSDMMNIAANLAGKGDKQRRVCYVRTLWDGFCRTAGKQHAQMNGHAVIALENQLQQYYAMA